MLLVSLTTTIRFHIFIVSWVISRIYQSFSSIFLSQQISQPNEQDEIWKKCESLYNISTISVHIWTVCIFCQYPSLYIFRCLFHFLCPFRYVYSPHRSLDNLWDFIYLASFWVAWEHDTHGFKQSFTRPELKFNMDIIRRHHEVLSKSNHITTTPPQPQNVSHYNFTKV